LAAVARRYKKLVLRRYYQNTSNLHLYPLEGSLALRTDCRHYNKARRKKSYYNDTDHLLPRIFLARVEVVVVEVEGVVVVVVEVVEAEVVEVVEVVVVFLQNNH